MAEYTPEMFREDLRSVHDSHESPIIRRKADAAIAVFDDLLARVRRDAAREALCGLRESHAQTVSILAADSQARFYEEKILLRIDRYRDTHYPEETP